MDKFLFIAYKIISFILIISGISFIYVKTEFIGIMISGAYIYLFLNNISYKEKLKQKYYVDKKLYLELSKKYNIYVKNQKYLPQDVQNELNNINIDNEK